MVEGPGCTLNGEKIRARVRKGQTVKEIRGNLTNSTTKPGESPFCCLHGAQYSGVETLGKELFMYFGLKALRVHFGMSGSLRINPTALKERSGQSQRPALEIHLTNDTVCFFDSTVEIRWTEDCEQRVRSSSHLDVCSPKFSLSRSEEAVRAQGGRMLCDVLLDQSIMPGVGNIIKNEALFDSGLHPAVKVQQLTDKQIHHLVKMTRDFTLLFYKCRKSGSPLHRHYKVYKRPECGQCSHVITACRLGDHGRMTYFCERCQRGDPSGLDVSTLPVRNSLIGWVYRDQPEESVGKKEEEDWTCEVCTLINPPACTACDACLTARPKVHTEPTNPDSSPYPSDLIKYPCTAFKKPDQDLKLNWRSAFGTSTLIFSDFTPNKNNNSSNHHQLKPLNSPRGSHLNSTAEGSHKHNICQGTSSPNYASGGWDKHGYSAGENSHPSKKMRIDNGTPNSRVPTATAAAASPSSSAPPCPSAPCCSAHRRPAALRVVHKHGENKGRVFYTCSLPPETKCNFFEWADSHFPFCHHGKRCLMRTVLKLGPNNGRNFYTCSLIKGKQCDFFQWAANAPGC